MQEWFLFLVERVSPKIFKCFLNFANCIIVLLLSRKNFFSFFCTEHDATFMFLNGWGCRNRTRIASTKNWCPTVGRIPKGGGPGESRTPDLRIKSPLLCQLSYRSAVKKNHKWFTFWHL